MALEIVVFRFRVDRTTCFRGCTFLSENSLHVLAYYLNFKSLSASVLRKKLRLFSLRCSHLKNWFIHPKLRWGVEVHSVYHTCFENIQFES